MMNAQIVISEHQTLTTHSDIWTAGSLDKKVHKSIRWKYIKNILLWWNSVCPDCCPERTLHGGLRVTRKAAMKCVQVTLLVNIAVHRKHGRLKPACPHYKDVANNEQTMKNHKTEVMLGLLVNVPSAVLRHWQMIHYEFTCTRNMHDLKLNVDMMIKSLTKNISWRSTSAKNPPWSLLNEKNVDMKFM